MQRALILSAMLALPGAVAADSPFVRGDVNGNGRSELTDATQLFGFLFRGEARPACLDAADVDGSGSLQITDGTYLLSFLFLGGPQPPAPFPSCGMLPNEVGSGSSLGCESVDACTDETEAEVEIEIAHEKELMITDLSVVEDPCRTSWSDAACDDESRGAWTFGKLMASLAGLSSIDERPDVLSQFVVDWLRQMASDTSVNGFEVSGRPGVAHLVTRWAAISGFEDPNDPDLVLDMRRAPFRLLSIVSRLDLRRAADDGTAVRAGEGRFVFGILDIDSRFPDDPDQWRPDFGSVIFEYSLPAASDEEVIDWAQRWHALGSLPFGDEYNRALQAITRDFAGQGLDASVPGGSSLSQLRTNEISFGPAWELREFHLESIALSPEGASSSRGTVRLAQAPVAQTMDLRLDGTEKLRRFIDANLDPVGRGEHLVPLEFEGESFLAGSALLPNSRFAWTVPTYDCDEPRHQLSLNTCNGCHGGETGTPFLHVGIRRAGAPARLSRFLTGVDVRDPSCATDDSATPVRRFEDLERRANDLRGLLRIGASRASRTARSFDDKVLLLRLGSPRSVH